MFGLGSTTRAEAGADGAVGDGDAESVEGGSEGKRVEGGVDGLGEARVDAG